MIDLDKIDDAKAILKKWCDNGMESISTPVRYEQLLGLMNKLAAAEKDAARYRWLRDDYRHEYCVDDLFDGSSSSVDKRIDEAMQCSI